MMRTEEFTIQGYERKFREPMISLWERSVMATHHFVTPDDLAYFKSIVQTIDFNAFEVYCLIHEDRVYGFLGVANKKIEMLFLDPQLMGQGLGKKLILFALDELGADQVDVNEQNEKAVQFYTNFGFATYERTEKDSEGKNYPILKMKLNAKFESHDR